jgi:hypothetical protein
MEAKRSARKKKSGYLRMGFLVAVCEGEVYNAAVVLDVRGVLGDGT